MNRGLILLAGGLGVRFGGLKALADFGGQPLFNHVLTRVLKLVDEAVVVIRDSYTPDEFQRHVPSSVKIIRDKGESHGPLVGISTGMTRLHASYILALSCDLPLVNQEVLRRIFQWAEGYDAAVPQWHNGAIEALHAVYRREPALTAADEAILHHEYSVRDMIKRLPHIRYVPIREIRKLDSTLNTFRNVNTQSDLHEAYELYLAMQRK